MKKYIDYVDIFFVNVGVIWGEYIDIYFDLVFVKVMDFNVKGVFNFICDFVFFMSKNVSVEMLLKVIIIVLVVGLGIGILGK